MTRSTGLAALAALGVLAPVVLAAGTGFACAPQPFITIRPTSSAPAEAQVTVDGHLFDDGGRVEIRWNATDGALLATAQSADFVLTFTVPQTPPGLYTVLAVSRTPAGVQGAIARAAFQVTGPSEAATASHSPAPATTQNRSSRETVSFASVAATIGLLAIGGLGGGWIASRRRVKRTAASSSSGTPV